MKADVVAAGEKAGTPLDALYGTAGAALGRVLAVCDPPSAAALVEMQDRHPDLVVLRNEAALGRIGSWNRGLLLRERDVLLVDGAVVPAQGCLEEMIEVLHSSDRIASVAPLFADGGLPDLPRSTGVPTARGPCLLLRHTVLHMIGGFDPSFPDADDAQDDWAMRAQRMGLRHVRANRARAAGPAVPAPGRSHSALLLARHPHLPGQLRAPLPGATDEVLYQRTPIEDVAALLALLETPGHLIVGQPAAYRNRMLLAALARSAQAVVAASAEERAALVTELGLEEAKVEVVPSDAALTALFRRVAACPDLASLRHRALLADLLRSLGEDELNPPRSRRA